MSKKYLSTDSWSMAEAARRFKMLFGYFPDYIGVNPHNKEALVKSVIRMPVLRDYINVLMSTNPENDEAPAITMHQILIKPYDSVGYDYYILWSDKTLSVTPELVLNVNKDTVIKMLEVMGYHCYRTDRDGNGFDYFYIRNNAEKWPSINDLYLNIGLSHDEYAYPEYLKDLLENRVSRKFKESEKKPEKAPEHANCKADAEIKLKVHIDAKEAIKNFENFAKDLCNSMPINTQAKVIFPLNGVMHELQLDAFSITQAVNQDDGGTKFSIYGSSSKQAIPLKKEDSAGTLTVDGAKYNVIPVQE